MKKHKLMRWIFYFVGIIILTFGARTILLSGLGVGGLDAIAIGLSGIWHMSIGTFIIILGIVLLIIGSFINKHIQFTPIVTSIIMGWCYDGWGKLLFERLPQLTGKGIIGFTFLLGLLIAPIGAALYIISDISMGPVDYLMLSIKGHSRLSMQMSRIMIETIFVIIGILVNGPIGIGTICIMLFWGPILQVYCSIGLQTKKKVEKKRRNHTGK